MPVRKLWLSVASMSLVTSALCLTACSTTRTTQPRTTTPETHSATVETTPPGTMSGEQGGPGMGQQQPGMGQQQPGMGQQQQPGMGQQQQPGMGQQQQQPGQDQTPPPAAVSITEEQIVSIADAASKGEVEQAKLVATHSTNPKVKGFADRMLKDHTQAIRDISQISQRQRLMPSDNPVSVRLAENSRQLTDSLQTKKGKEFDREYIGAQVREHRMLLDMFDEKLIPAAKTPELKNALMQTRNKVEMHLREAEDIQRSLATGPQ